ncbi:hypothetical protein wCauATS_11120 [Wolbachia pipientis]
MIVLYKLHLLFSEEIEILLNLSVLFPLNNIKKMLIHIIAQSITAAIFIIAAAISAAK